MVFGGFVATSEFGSIIVNLSVTSYCVKSELIGTLRSDDGDGNGNLRSLGRAGPRRVGVPAKIEITNFTSENVDDGH